MTEEHDKARATIAAWIGEAVSEIGPHDARAILELLMIRHGSEVRAGSPIAGVLLQQGFEAAMRPYLDEGLSGEAAADAAEKDILRGAEIDRGRQHKRH